MNAKKILLSLAVMGTLTLGFADATTPVPTGIDAEITAIQTAKPEDRVSLMNQFKIQLSNMNAEDRSAAIAQMQGQMQNHQVGDIHEQAHEMGEMQQNRMQEHAGEMQSNMNEGMNRMQNMNQQQAGNHIGQAMQEAGAQMHNGTPAGGASTHNMQTIEQNYQQRGSH